MNTKVAPCAHGTESAFEQWWAVYAETITPFTTPKQFACDAYAAGMADPMVAPKSCPPCHGDCNQGRTCPARKK